MVATVAVVVALGSVTGGVASAEQDAVALLERAARAAEMLPFSGRLVVAATSPAGPTITELALTHEADGSMRVGRSEAWMVGRDERGGGFLWRPEPGGGPGHLLGLTGMESHTFSVAGLLAKYDVEVTGAVDLVTGPATELEVRRRDGGRLCERLFVDRATGLVVRRETYAHDVADATRVIAFTELDVAGDAMPAPTATPDEHVASLTVEDDELEAMRGAGWAAPSELGQGYRLVGGYAPSEGDATSLHLVYTDGLYTLSLYEQRGRIDRDAMAGTTVRSLGGGVIYAWPGAELERIAWSGDGHTFTVVADAPSDEVMAAVAGLPVDPEPSMLHRLGRGVARVVSWLWPFG